MLFLYRPRETWMPFATPRDRTQQAAYRRQLHDQFAATRRVAPAVPSAAGDPAYARQRLEELHDAGVLTDTEFASATARLRER